MTDRPDPSTTTSGAAETAQCPYCGSTDTTRDHPKGPGLCRSLYFCEGCEQPFETFG